jgi:hypothetical protein
VQRYVAFITLEQVPIPPAVSHQPPATSRQPSAISHHDLITSLG